MSEKKFILIAEDDKFYAHIYKVKLGAEGYDVEVAGNGEDLLAQISRRKPDLVLLDLIMPIKDGFDTLTELRKNKDLDNVKIIVMSSLSQKEDSERAHSLGATDYVVKTEISIQDMTNKIRQYLD